MMYTFRKTIALCLMLFIIASLGAGCSVGEKDEPSVSSRVVTEVKSKVQFMVGFQYDIVGLPQVTAYVQETGTNTYEVTGKVTVKDKYGDTYTGKYDAVATYDPETDDISVDEEIGKLYKD